VLDANGGMPIEIIATDIAGLFPDSKGELIYAVCFRLLDK
jgi:hypothetical protein